MIRFHKYAGSNLMKKNLLINHYSLINKLTCIFAKGNDKPYFEHNTLNHSVNNNYFVLQDETWIIFYHGWPYSKP